MVTTTDTTPDEVRIEIRIDCATWTGLQYIAATLVGAVIGLGIVVVFW